MINIELTKDGDKFIIASSGHSNEKICCAVSVLEQHTFFNCVEFGDGKYTEEDDEKGIFVFEVTQNTAVTTLIKAFMNSISKLSKQFSEEINWRYKCKK